MFQNKEEKMTLKSAMNENTFCNVFFFFLTQIVALTGPLKVETNSLTQQDKEMMAKVVLGLL